MKTYKSMLVIILLVSFLNIFIPEKDVSAASTGVQVAGSAKIHLGTPYLYGGTGPNSFDCSGFISYVYNNNGYNISRKSVADYWGLSTIRKVSTPQVGDMIFFENTYKSGPSHMGIMTSSTEFIHAGDDGIAIANINNTYWKEHFLGYGRLAPDQQEMLLSYARSSFNVCVEANLCEETSWGSIDDAVRALGHASIARVKLGIDDSDIYIHDEVNYVEREIISTYFN
ncbi:MAG: C40 family peptidase [Bacillaceae bacterium]